MHLNAGYIDGDALNHEPKIILFALFNKCYRKANIHKKICLNHIRFENNVHLVISLAERQDTR